jgi:hypothetical protein
LIDAEASEPAGVVIHAGEVGSAATLAAHHGQAKREDPVGVEVFPKVPNFSRATAAGESGQL